MFQAVYPVLGRQECFPFYLAGIGISSPEFHTVRDEGLISHQILFTLEGTGKIIINDEEYIAKKGSIFYVAAGVPHEYYPIGETWTTCWLVFRGDHLSVLMERMHFPSYQFGTAKNIDQLQQLFDRIYTAATEPGDTEERCSLMVYQYIMMVRNLLITRQSNQTDTVIDNAISYIEHHYKDDITLQKLASLCGISTQHFCRVFREKMEMRPLEYVARKRISMAKVALYDTNAPITKVGKSVGYDDANYFGIVFKKYEGVSPSEFRKSKNTLA